jgi:hypothetical protein
MPAVDHERLADDVLGAAEAALPIPIGQDHSQRITRRVVLDAEGAADDRLHTQQGQCGGAHQQGLNAFRITASGDRDLGGIPRADPLERLPRA